jgi:IMP dehydrogenase
MTQLPLGLTFDDVLLVPSYSDVLPKDVDTSTVIAPGIRLSIPIVSAAMDTVTEAGLAIALAREGGLGVIHKNMTPQRQASEVDAVKRSESGMIADPITLQPQHRIEDALALMAKYSISGIPIVNRGGQLAGILTNRDLRFEQDFDRPIADVMTSANLVTVPEGTDLDTARKLLHKHRIEKLLVVDQKKRLKGMITVKDIMKRMKHPHACKDQRGRLRVGAAVGVAKDSLGRAERLVAAGVDLLVLDSSHGNSQGVVRMARLLKKRFPDLPLVAGNVATGDGVERLVDAGADCVKVGIGPGSICTTRVVTGAGVPQMTALFDCGEVAGRTGTPLLADGGIRYSGDITKCLAAGAACVMIGSLFAGTEESPGETILFEGRTFKSYRGMGSTGAMRQGSRDRYFQEGQGDKLVPEGIEGRVPYRGPLSDTVFQLLGGVKAGMGLCGAPSITRLQAVARFVQVTGAGVMESHPHDVTITKEAPNYRSARN